MSPIREIQQWLERNELAGWIISSQDEFLSEFAPPHQRRLQWATGFRGSTGVAIVLRNEAALFLDGRYFLQGKADSAGRGIDVESATLAARRDWLKARASAGSTLGMDSRQHSATDVAQWRSLALELGVELRAVPEDPVQTLWTQGRPPASAPSIVDYPVEYAGETYQEKCAALVEHVRNVDLQALLIADPEDVSWLLNVRLEKAALRTPVGEWHTVPACESRVLVQRDARITWFVAESRIDAEVRKRSESIVAIAAPEDLRTALLDCARKGQIGLDPARTPAALVAIVEETGRAPIADQTPARRRWRKHIAEHVGAKRVHVIDAVAVVRFMAWLARTVSQSIVTEFEAAQQLQTFREECPDFVGPSMPLMSASGPSGAEPHYVPQRESCRRLNDHPIYWMDSGGQYLGGTTDNTLTMAVGVPEARHVFAHTTVLKAFLSLAMARFPANTCGIQLDTIARQILWQEGMDFAHATGHGVGNYLNIHEGPILGRTHSQAIMTNLEPGMIVTNEPGYYARGDFGLRIESHMAVVISPSHEGFLEFETLSRLPMDPRLTDFDRLSPTERQWLWDYHQTVLQDLGPSLDSGASDWLRELVRAWENAA